MENELTPDSVMPQYIDSELSAPLELRTIAVRVTQQQYDDIWEAATAHSLSRGGFVRQLIALYLEACKRRHQSIDEVIDDLTKATEST